MISRTLAVSPNPCIDWVISRQCPVGHRVVFPDGIDGVEFIESEPAGRIGCLWGEVPDTVSWAVALKVVLAAMKIPGEKALELGVMFRGLRGNAFNFEDFLFDVRHARMASFGPIATLLDSRREEILAAIGARALHQKTRPMTHDLDREAGDVRDYLTEWMRLLSCRKVVTNTPNSAILWPRTLFAEARALQ